MYTPTVNNIIVIIFRVKIKYYKINLSTLPNFTINEDNSSQNNVNFIKR